MSRYHSGEISKNRNVAGWKAFHQQVSLAEHKDEVSKDWRITDQSLYRARDITIKKIIRIDSSHF